MYEELGRIYYELGEPDSTYKYSKIVYNKLPHNLLHAVYLMDVMVELELYDELKQAFRRKSIRRRCVV